LGVGCWGESVDAWDGAIDKAWQGDGEILAHGQTEPAAALDDVEDGRDLGAGLFAAQMDPVLAADRQGRIEFFARLLDNSNSGYSRKRMSLLHKESV